MFPFQISDVMFVMAICMFVLGIVVLISGLIMLLTRVSGSDVKRIAVQTTKLAEKGIAEDVAGLVGNASVLIEALNGLVRTVSGVGVFLIIISFVLMAASYGLLYNLK